jgi:hypothetical protein
MQRESAFCKLRGCPIVRLESASIRSTPQSIEGNSDKVRNLASIAPSLFDMLDIMRVRDILL